MKYYLNFAEGTIVQVPREEFFSATLHYGGRFLWNEFLDLERDPRCPGLELTLPAMEYAKHYEEFWKGGRYDKQDFSTRIVRKKNLC